MYTLGHMNQLNSGPQSNQVTPETKPAETLKSVEAKIEAAKNGLESTREEIRANVGKPGAEGLLKSLRARFDMQTEVVTELSQQLGDMQYNANRKEREGDAMYLVPQKQPGNNLVSKTPPEDNSDPFSAAMDFEGKQRIAQ